MNKFTKALAAIMLMMVFALGCTKPDEPNNVSGNYNGHDYVDLGLPSGTLWATCNVGADTPEGYGDYFAWGETEPKAVYYWDTYKYCEGDLHSLTKYCCDSTYGYNGFVDNLTELQIEDDAAVAKWGDVWRMPTETQWKELMDNTVATWTLRNEVQGLLFSANNGNALFLPASGSGDYLGGGNNGFGYIGHYWSSSHYVGDIIGSDEDVYKTGVWNLNFNSSGCSMRIGCRAFGMSVRPVCYME